MNKRLVRPTLVWLIILVILPLPLLWLLNAGLTDSFHNLLIYDLGLLAYTYWLTIVYLSTRPKWLERWLGLPKMYLVHGLLGVCALALALLHSQLSFSMQRWGVLTGWLALYLAIGGVFYAAFFLSGWLVDYSPRAAKLKKRLQRPFNHRVSLWLHRLNFVVIALIWFHVHLIPRLYQLTGFIIFFDCYTLVAVAAYCWQHFVATDLAKNKGRVIGNRPLSPRVQEVTVKLSSQASPYQAGAVYFLSFRGRGIPAEWYSFSVASASQAAPPEVKLVIDRVGDFTKRIGQVPPGCPVVLQGPFGRFEQEIEATAPQTPLVLIAMGVGIAPLRSLVQRYVGKRPITLLWSVHVPTERYFEGEFKDLAKREATFAYHSQVGRLTKERLATLLTESERVRAKVIVVGSAQGVLAIEGALLGLGFKKRQFIDERLTI